MSWANVWDIIQGVFMLATIVGGFYLAIRKAGPERQTLDATTAAQYAQAAKLKGEENTKLEEEINKLEARLVLVERKKFRVVMEFTIGDPPELGKVTIEPIIDLPDNVLDDNMKLQHKPRKV
jgi:hypothetical protein